MVWTLINFIYLNLLGYFQSPRFYFLFFVCIFRNTIVLAFLYPMVWYFQKSYCVCYNFYFVVPIGFALMTRSVWASHFTCLELHICHYNSNQVCLTDSNCKEKDCCINILPKNYLLRDIITMTITTTALRGFEKKLCCYIHLNIQ